MTQSWFRHPEASRCSPRRPTAAKSAVADLENHDPKSEARFRLATHPSKLAAAPLAPQDDEISCHCNVDIRHGFRYVYGTPRPSVGRARAGRLLVRGEGGARARSCNPLPGGFGLSARPALRPVREKHRCTETGKLRGKPDGGLIPGSAELKPGGGVRSPKPEPRWNADRCAPGDPGAAGPDGPANTHCVCRRSASDSLLSFLA
jgi:hypothetical protein